MLIKNDNEIVFRSFHQIFIRTFQNWLYTNNTSSVVIWFVVVVRIEAKNGFYARVNVAKHVFQPFSKTVSNADVHQVMFVDLLIFFSTVALCGPSPTPHSLSRK